ncbi:hypothetical protein JCM10213_002084 [Rhodosporidiobolus nylandii]
MSTATKHTYTHSGKDAHPAKFQAAVFPARGAPLELITVDFREPGKDEIAIKVHAAAVGNNDAISANGLLAHSKFPRTPGQVAYGQIVAVGGSERSHGGGGLSNVLSKLHLAGKKPHEGEGFKVGDMVIGVGSHALVEEYATLKVDRTCLASDKLEPVDQLFACSSGAAALQAYDRFAKAEKQLLEEEKRVMKSRNEALGFKGEGVLRDGVRFLPSTPRPF